LSTRNFCVCVCGPGKRMKHSHTHTRADKKKREIGTSPKTPDRIKRLFKHAQDTCNARTAPQREEREHFLFFLISKRRKRKKKKKPALIVPRCSFLRVFDTYREAPAQPRRVANKRRGTQNSFVDVIIVNEQFSSVGGGSDSPKVGLSIFSDSVPP
jgi:hypothetical protein